MKKITISKKTLRLIGRDLLVIAVLTGAVLLAPQVEDYLARPKAPAAAPAEEAPPKPPEAAFAADDECTGFGSLAELRVYKQSTPQADGDIINVGGAAVGKSLVQGILDGGPNVDTLKAGGAGFVDIDGVHVIGLEIIDMRNGQPNLVVAFAEGLATLAGGHAVILGDVDADEVHLDNCLTWDAPVPVLDGGNQLLRYDGHDTEGDTVSVSVLKGLKVAKLVRGK